MATDGTGLHGFTPLQKHGEVVLIEYSSHLGRFQFVHRHYGRFPGSNTFTVIVGKNGTGKSRLLRSLVVNLLGGVLSGDQWDRSERGDRYEPLGRLEKSNEPAHVISVSTSPFDRFPLPRRSGVIPGYSYLGLRGLPSSNLSLAYLSKIVSTLILSAHGNPAQASAVAGVLEYLEYQPVISISFQLIPESILKDLMNAPHPHQVVEERMRKAPVFPPNEVGPAYRQLLETAPDDIRRGIEMIENRRLSRRQRNVNLQLDGDGLSIKTLEHANVDSLNQEFELSEALFLLRIGVLRLRDVVLFKKDKGESFHINDASSGEQAVVLTLLGIGSQIKDNTLVCIDEPEVCLHPEWQEKYIHLLYRTFSHFSGCHFIIATHSPQIVAQLPAGNCHVMSMETGVANPAGSYSHKSIDYQLAEVFGAPGYRNEYLSRTALNLFSSVTKKRAFDTSALETMAKLDSMVHLLNADDPVLDLILALREMRNQYE